MVKLGFEIGLDGFINYVFCYMYFYRWSLGYIVGERMGYKSSFIKLVKVLNLSLDLYFYFGKI